MKLLHVIPALGPGGASRSLVMLVRELHQQRPDVRHRVILLEERVFIPLLFDLKRGGAEVLRAPPPERIRTEIEAADVVLVHFWNAPRLWRTIAGGLPPARYMVWLHVLGAHPPQVVNQRLLAAAARIAGTGRLPPSLASNFPDTPIVPGMFELHRFEAVASKPHAGFNAHYVGTTNGGKMHPRFIEMMARVDIPDLRVRICGGPLEPAMQEALERVPDPTRFECLGFVDDVATLLSTSDVFAYPLSKTTYATTDKSLQEAMFAGVPPVIFPHGGPAAMVQDGRTGIVASSEAEFVNAVEFLHRHPDERKRIGANARAYALEAYQPRPLALAMMRLLEDSLAAERNVLFPAIAAPSAALLFLLSQDWDEEEARSAIDSWRSGKSNELIRFAARLDDAAFQVEGGILHWRRETMDEPLIRTWASEWLARTHRPDEAKTEAQEARRLGAPALSVEKQ